MYIRYPTKTRQLSSGRTHQCCSSIPDVSDFINNKPRSVFLNVWERDPLQDLNRPDSTPVPKVQRLVESELQLRQSEPLWETLRSKIRERKRFCLFSYYLVICNSWLGHVSYLNRDVIVYWTQSTLVSFRTCRDKEWSIRSEWLSSDRRMCRMWFLLWPCKDKSSSCRCLDLSVESPVSNGKLKVVGK